MSLRLNLRKKRDVLSMSACSKDGNQLTIEQIWKEVAEKSLIICELLEKLSNLSYLQFLEP